MNGEHTKHFDPLALALFAAAGQGKDLSLAWLWPNVTSYLERMDFFEHCSVVDANVPKNVRHDRRHVLVEITPVSSIDSCDDVANKLACSVVGISPNAPLLSATEVTSADDRAMLAVHHNIRYMLQEILTNSLSHARLNGHWQSRAWVAAQYYKRTDYFHIAIVDDGCGFLETLKTHRLLESKDHISAINVALQPRVSCNRELGSKYETINQGIGLTVARRIAEKANGTITIASGDALWESGRGGRLLPGRATWGGVAINITAQRAQLATFRPGSLMPSESPPNPRIRWG